MVRVVASAALGLSLLALARPSAAQEEDPPWRPTLLAGAAAGVTNTLAYGFEGHLGFGARRDQLALFGVADYAQTHNDALLASWSLIRRQLALSALVLYFPVRGYGFHLHASLGGGSAWDTFEWDSENTTTHHWLAVGSAGIGWQPLSFVARSALPAPVAQSSNGNTYGSGQDVLFLLMASVALDVGPKEPPRAH